MHVSNSIRAGWLSHCRRWLRPTSLPPPPPPPRSPLRPPPDGDCESHPFAIPRTYCTARNEREGYTLHAYSARTLGVSNDNYLRKKKEKWEREHCPSVFSVINAGRRRIPARRPEFVHRDACACARAKYSINDRSIIACNVANRRRAAQFISKIAKIPAGARLFVSNYFNYL